MLEFWPEYNSGPLWSNDGRNVDVADIGLPIELAGRLRDWNARYDGTKLPFERNNERMRSKMMMQRKKRRMRKPIGSFSHH